MTRIISLAAASAALFASACTPARMAIPDHLSSTTEPLELTGMGGARSGSFRLAGAPGSFARGADRLGIMDPLMVRHSGGGRFLLTPSPLSQDIAGRCSYREGQVNVGVISVTPKRFAYHCDFTDGTGNLSGGMMIHDRNGTLGGLTNQAEREGILDYRGQRLIVRSVHRLEGGALPVRTPIGYAFLADGRQVGAVDLNGTNKTILVPRSGPIREAVIAGSLALSVLWDPADIYAED